jgi:flagellar protein FlaG
MTSTAPIGPSPEVTPVQPAQAPASTQSTGSSQAFTAPIDDIADLRLVIEDDKAAGSFVYVTINPVTGEVVSQIPREQLLKMREDPAYKPGSIVDQSS